MNYALRSLLCILKSLGRSCLINIITCLTNHVHINHRRMQIQLHRICKISIFSLPGNIVLLSSLTIRLKMIMIMIMIIIIIFLLKFLKIQILLKDLHENYTCISISWKLFSCFNKKIEKFFHTPSY